MDRVVVDTDVLSFYLKNDSRFANYANVLDGKQFVISFQTQAELMLWQELHNWGDVRRERTARIIAQQCIIFPVDEALCRIWAKLRRGCAKIGPSHSGRRCVDCGDCNCTGCAACNPQCW